MFCKHKIWINDVLKTLQKINFLPNYNNLQKQPLEVFFWKKMFLEI